MTVLPAQEGGYSWEFLVGVCRPVLQILTLFQTKTCHFPRSSSDQTSKTHTRFPHLAFRQKLCHHFLDKSANKNSFRIGIFLLRSCSFGIKKINALRHSRSSLVNHTRFLTKMDKVHTCAAAYPFSDQKGPKTIPFGGEHTYMAIIQGSTPGNPHS